jgi:hypothetical protein
MRAAGRVAAACALGVVLLSPLRAHADADKRDAPGWAFGSQPGELALLGGAGASLLTFFLPQRYNTGWKPYEARAFEPVWGSLSDLTGSVIGCTVQIANGYMFETAYLDHPAVDNPYERALRVPLIAGEAALFTTGAIIALKRITGRCRPRAYKNGRCLQTRSAHEGFPSGHTGPVGSIAAVYLTLALRTQHGQPAYRYAPFAIAELGAIGTGVLRVVSGAHSWEDAGLGWAVGHVVGALVALAHPMEKLGGVDETASALRGAGSRISASAAAREQRLVSWSSEF